MELQSGWSIQFDTEGTALRVRVFCVLNGEKFSTMLTVDEGDHFDALLWAEAINNAINDRIEKVRKYEYERGYKDGRGKRTKVGWFPRTLHLPEEA